MKPNRSNTKGKQFSRAMLFCSLSNASVKYVHCSNVFENAFIHATNNEPRYNEYCITLLKITGRRKEKEEFSVFQVRMRIMKHVNFTFGVVGA